MDALIFDFDGVVIDSEPIHLAGFQHALQSLSVDFPAKVYYEKYLGYDDRDCFAALIRDRSLEITESQVAEMMASKTAFVKATFAESVQPLDGSTTLIHRAYDAGIPLAVCSGALRDEIDLACRRIGISECFSVIVAAEDVAHGKPDPQGYNLALARLCQVTGTQLAPHRCVAIEDSPAGIASARKAGLKVLAVTNSYQAEALGAASITDSLATVTLETLDQLL